MTSLIKLREYLSDDAFIELLKQRKELIAICTKEMDPFPELYKRTYYFNFPEDRVYVILENVTSYKCTLKSMEKISYIRRYSTRGNRWHTVYAEALREYTQRNQNETI